MNDRYYRALVADDESSIRQLTIRALSGSGFSCDAAADGAAALALAEQNDYDLLVTDLRMPNMHGHALATRVLERESRPFIVVITGVAEPRLAEDLIRRGVDSIEYKPIDYRLFATKVRAMVERFQAAQAARVVAPAAISGDVAGDPASSARPPAPPRSGPIPLEEIEARLEHVMEILPISQTAVDIFNMVSSDAFSAEQIAAAIERDASLTAEVLRLANSAFYNPKAEQIVDMKRAIPRIGQRRIGELTLANSALAAVTAGALPWLDLNITWRRSIAAGVAMEYLLDKGGHHALEKGLLISAILHPLGRVVLGSLFPDDYRRMVELSRTNTACLRDYERKTLPLPHGQLMAKLLQNWGVPVEICGPLNHMLYDDVRVDRLAEPDRTRTRLLKAAIFLGRLAAGRWESWDYVEIPPVDLFRSLRIDFPEGLVDKIAADTEALIRCRKESQSRVPADVNPQPETAHRTSYFNASPQPYDFLPHLFRAAGVQTADAPLRQLFSESDAPIINCMDAVPDQLDYYAQELKQLRPLIVTESTRLSEFQGLGQPVTLPACFARFSAAVEQFLATTAGRRKYETQDTGSVASG